MGRSHTARMFHALQHVALLLTAYLVNAAGPPARGSNSPTCPGTVWNETLFSSSWGGVLPGDVANDVFPRDAVSSLPVPGYPLSPPPSCYHGAGHYVGWVSTNGFVRAFMVLYDVFVTIGEAKHGFWQWTQPGQDDDVEFWWCQLGGNTNSTKYLSGHDDSSSTGGHTDSPTNSSTTMNGMDALWQHIRQTPNIDNYGPLAIKAKLPDFATSAVQMRHAAGVHTWGNNGNSTRPYYFPVDTLQSAEFYIFEAPYMWPEMFHVSEPCHIDPNVTTTWNTTCALQNTFVGMIVEKHATSGLTGMTTSGLHYGPDAEACPDSCGAGPCRCNAVLFDLVLHGFLNDKYTDALEFIPTWVNKWLGPTGALPTVDHSGASSDASMSTGLVVLIAICILMFGILLGGAAIWFYLKNKLGIDVKAAAEEQPPNPIIDENNAEMGKSNADRSPKHKVPEMGSGKSDDHVLNDAL